VSSKYRFEIARSENGIKDKGHVILCDDPGTWALIVFPNAMRQNPLQFIVHHNGRTFGFTARGLYDQTVKPIRGIGTEIMYAGVKAYKFAGLTSPAIKAEPRKFEDREEQETVFALLEAAFHKMSPSFPSLYQPLSFADNLERARKSGELISDAN